MEQVAREMFFRLTLSGSFIARGQRRGRDVEARGHSHVVPLLLDERMLPKQKELVRTLALKRHMHPQKATLFPQGSPRETERASDCDAAIAKILTPSSSDPSS